MDKYFSYYRVSSKNQEETGVSLEAQKEANERYAQEEGLEIVKEFREVQSAAKTGRKQFNLMLKEIRQHKDVRGIIFHDVDRSSRSMSDWVKVLNLDEENYEIHFSREGILMNDRSSRLMSDIKIVIAQDFIRNLSQETKKGLYKRLEQGFCVTGHSIIGYVSKGAGIKEPDSKKADLVKQCYELYATEKYSLKDLAEVMYKKGLRSVNGNKVQGTKIDRILRNKFYIGLMVVKGKTFNGNHKPIIPIKLFYKVQNILDQRYIPRTRVHKYIFSNLLFCGYCGKRLRTMKAKKRYHYYYCRNKDCKMRTILENKVEGWILDELKKIKFSRTQVEAMIRAAKKLKQSSELAMEERAKGIELRIKNIKTKIDNLLDMRLENKIPEDVYNKKRQDFMMDFKYAEEELKGCRNIKESDFDRIEELAKLLGRPLKAYREANYENKANLIKTMMINIKVFPDGLTFDWQTPFDLINKTKTPPKTGSRSRGVARGNRTLITSTTNWCVNRYTIATTMVLREGIEPPLQA